jgi:hypothetical protein
VGFAEILADETAHHYAELRQRRVPLPLVWLLTARFHRDLCYSVIQDDQFSDVVRRVLAPAQKG